MIQPLVSVIVPVYDVLPYLKEALDSIVNQSYDNLEIIIIDDGSKDGSGDICDAYRYDSRIQVIHQQNMGLSAARNVGLDRMTGEYVAFLDPDDTLHPEMIQRMMSAMEASRADIVICGYETFLSDSLLGGEMQNDYHLFKNAVYSTTEALNELIADVINQSVWNKLYRKTLWEDIRFPEGYVFEDVQTTYRVIERAQRIQTLPECLYFHRVRQGSITRTSSPRNYMDWSIAHHILEDYVVSHTPKIFSECTRDLFIQNTLRHEMLNCAEIMFMFPNTADNTVTDWIASIKEKACRASNMRGVKNRFVRCVFLLCPSMLPILRQIFRKIKASFKG